MLHLIIGEKGKGKTKVIHEMANKAVTEAKGSIVYLDRNSKHMYDLSNRIRLIDVSRYPIKNSDEFIGFVCGIISQDHDLEQLYLDGFLDCAKLTADNAEPALLQLNSIGEMFGIDINISFSSGADTLSEELRKRVLVEL
ncbi:MAG: twitching motility protein PilT [Lachnospiraceae bacterium]|nr:twitching motility protein PilT [Lachnospiraceae bacterium]